MMYAYFRKLVYFSTECVFAPNAYRGHARVLLKDMERIDPSVIMNVIHSGESLRINETVNLPKLTNCERCSYVSSQAVCKACVLLEGLNSGLPKLGIGKSSKVRRVLEEKFKNNVASSSKRAEEKNRCGSEKSCASESNVSGCLCKDNLNETLKELKF